MSVDRVDLGIMWDRLIAVTDEVLLAIVRTAFSVGVREAWDLACVAFDARGRALAQATLSMPAFIGTAPLTMRHMLARFPAATLEPGDVLVTNDPWLGTGHTPDVCVARPVFADRALVGFVMTITHLPDVGGAGLAIANRSVFEEGLILPVCKLYRAGEPNDELFELIAANVRTPDQVIGDVMANVAGTAVGERLLRELMAEYGLRDLTALADGIVAQTERALRRELAALPDGTYRNTVRAEGVDRPIDLACAVTVRGDGVAVDFAGTGPAVAQAINVPFGYTRAFTAYALKCLTIPSLPNNEGALLPLTVSAPDGCVLNARKPSPTGGRHTVGWFIVPLLTGALAAVLPDRAPAESGMASLFLVQGTHPQGHPFVTQYFLAGGLGALPGLDGQHAVPSPTNNAVVPSEVWERETGMRVLHRRLLPDSGGPGAFRGGLGQEAALRNDSGHPVEVALFGLRTEFPPQGLAGGGPGAARQFLVNGRPVPPKGRLTLAPGDTLTVREAGGGGHGDPRRRAAERIKSDLAQGYLTPAAARRDYGYDPPD